jgi:hypothetical protein
MRIVQPVELVKLLTHRIVNNTTWGQNSEIQYLTSFMFNRF